MVSSRSALRPTSTRRAPRAAQMRAVASRDGGSRAEDNDPLGLGHCATLRQKSELILGSFCAANSSQRG